MSAYNQARTVEAEAWQRLKPFISENSSGQFVLIEKSPLAPILQETIGDFMFNHHSTGRLVSVEIKAEREFTGNFFLETWSNLNVSTQEGWEARGSNPGWLLKTHPTLYFYYFLDCDKLYVIQAFKLFRWAFSSPSKSGAVGGTRINDFRRKPQSKYVQKNDTHGHLVPISVVFEEVGFALVYPRQFELVPKNDFGPNAHDAYW